MKDLETRLEQDRKVRALYLKFVFLRFHVVRTLIPVPIVKVPKCLYSGERASYSLLTAYRIGRISLAEMPPLFIVIKSLVFFIPFPYYLLYKITYTNFANS
jgi:hypothetical protein